MFKHKNIIFEFGDPFEKFIDSFKSIGATQISETLLCYFEGTLFSSKIELIEFRDAYFADLAGSFICMFLDLRTRTLTIYTDPVGDSFLFFSTKHGFTVSTSLIDFSKDKYVINNDLVFNQTNVRSQGYLKTAITDVYQSAPGMKLIYDFGVNQLDVINLHDDEGRMRSAFANKIDITEHEAVDHIEGLLTETFKSIHAIHGDIGMMLSDGMDSSCMLAIANKNEIPINSIIKVLGDTVNPKLQQLGSYSTTFKTVGNVSTVTVEDTIKPDIFSNPNHEYWLFYLIEYSSTIIPLLENTTCMLRGGFGDTFFLHRTKYLISWLLHTKHRYYMDYIKSLYKNGLSWHLEPMSRGMVEHIIINDHYSYSPLEVTSADLYTISHSEDFISWLMKKTINLHGVSYDNEIRRLTNKTMLSPFKDHRIRDFVLSLPDDLLEKSMKHSFIQQTIINSAFDYVPARKGGNYNLWKNGYPVSDELVKVFKKAVDFYLSVECDLGRRANAEALYKFAIDSGIMYGQHFDILISYYWYQNWINQ